MGRSLNLETPEVFEPLLQPARYKGAWGGRGSAKSHFFAELLIEKCLLERTRAVCIREKQISLEQSCKRLLEDKIDKFKLNSEFRVMNTHIKTPDDGVIIFQGMQKQTAESIKSLEGFNVAWVEEAQAISERSLTLLRPTIRQEGSELWFSWNPRDKKDPIEKFLRSDDTPSDAIVVRSNFRDNPWFPDVLRREMELDRRRDPDKYSHVWLGQYEANSEARVFKNWVEDEFETPDDVMLYFGGDWGFSVDPTVLVRCWLRERAGERAQLMIDHEAYQVGVEIDHIPALFDTVPGSRNWPITADSARPETISYLKRHGFPKIESAIKGANSVKEGVIFLQGYDIVVHPRCVHTIEELIHYKFKRNELTNTVTPILEDKKNHVIDSLRYAVEKLRKPQVREFVTW